MHNLHIERSNVTPEILFIPASQRMEIAGECYPENPLPFFQPLLHHLCIVLFQPPDRIPLFPYIRLIAI